MPIKVLVVDDATFVRDMVKRTVRQMAPDAELLEAPDGARAMSLIKGKGVDLILSDWEMPEMSGDELLRWVRDQPQYASTPFIMITSRGDRNHVMAAVEAGVSDYLSKPFSAEELTRKIAKQLKNIGYKPSGHANPFTRGTAFSSVDVLTAGRAAVPPPHPSNVAGRKPTAGNASKFKGKACLRFPHTRCDFEVQEASPQALGGHMQRIEMLPTVFDQAAVDVMTSDGQTVARLNAYVHSLSAAEPSPDSERVRIIVRFVDQDPIKLQALADLIG